MLFIVSRTLLMSQRLQRKSEVRVPVSKSAGITLQQSAIPLALLSVFVFPAQIRTLRCS